MKKFLLVLGIMFLATSAFATGEGQGTAALSPTLSNVGSVISIGITFTAGAKAWTNGSKLYVVRPAGWTDFAYSSAGAITVTSSGGTVTGWVTDGKSLTITVTNLTALTGKIFIGYTSTTVHTTLGNVYFYMRSDPDSGGSGTALMSSPYITISPALTPANTKTNTPVYSATITKTVTLTITKTHTITPYNTMTITPTVTPTITKTITPTITETEIASITDSPTITPTATETIVATATATFTFTPQQTQIPVSIGAVVKSKFTEAREKGLLYGWFDRISTAGLDTTKSYEIFTSSYSNYTFKISMKYTGDVSVYLYELSAADYSAGGTTITARNCNRDINYAGLTANTLVYEDGGYNTDTAVATEIWTQDIGGGNNKEFYEPVNLSGNKHYILIISTKETDNEGVNYMEFYGN